MKFILFDRAFSRRKIDAIADILPACYAAMEDLAGRRVRWPAHIEAMDEEELAEGRARGKGHGLYYPGQKRIAINASMSAQDILLNVIHENLHHAFPRASDEEINFDLLPRVWRAATGRPMPRKWATGTPR